MKSILVLFSFLFSVTAMAQVSRVKMPGPVEEPGSLQIYPLGMEMRYERNSDQEFALHNFLNFAFAYQKNSLSALFEYSKYSEDSGNSTTSIDHTHQELILWGRWHFFKSNKDSIAWQYSLYGGLGIGGYQDAVKTTFMGTSQNDESGTKVMSGISFGGDVGYNLNKDFALLGTLEGRTLFSSDFDPNPTVTGVARIGIQFKLN